MSQPYNKHEHFRMIKGKLQKNSMLTLDIIDQDFDINKEELKKLTLSPKQTQHQSDMQIFNFVHQLTNSNDEEQAQPEQRNMEYEKNSFEKQIEHKQQINVKFSSEKKANKTFTFDKVQNQIKNQEKNNKNLQTINFDQHIDLTNNQEQLTIDKTMTIRKKNKQTSFSKQENFEILKENEFNSVKSDQMSRIFYSDGLRVFKLIFDSNDLQLYQKVLIAHFSFSVVFQLILNSLQLNEFLNSNCDQDKFNKEMVIFLFVLVIGLKLTNLSLLNLAVQFKTPYKVYNNLLSFRNKYPALNSFLIQGYIPLLQLPLIVFNYANCSYRLKFMSIKTSYVILTLIGTITILLITLLFLYLTSQLLDWQRLLNNFYKNKIIQQSLFLGCYLYLIAFNVLFIIIVIYQLNSDFLPYFFMDYLFYLEILILLLYQIFQGNRRSQVFNQ